MLSANLQIKGEANTVSKCQEQIFQMLCSTQKDHGGVMDLPAVDKANVIYERRYRKGSILVANGGKYVKKPLSAILTRMGYDVVASNSGDEAFELF